MRRLLLGRSWHGHFNPEAHFAPWTNPWLRTGWRSLLLHPTARPRRKPLQSSVVLEAALTVRYPTSGENVAVMGANLNKFAIANSNYGGSNA